MCGPAFLKDASNTVRNEFKRIWFDEKLTLDEKSSEFQKLAYSTLNGEALEKFNLFEKELKERKQAREQRINSLSPAAREAYEKWNGLRKQERLYLAGLPQDVRAELRLVCAYCGTHKFGHDRRRAAGFSPRTAHADAVEVDAMLRRSVRDVLSQAAGECAQVF
ncbi:Protein F40E10.5 [Aphelenchoides avenae]|nr:Protein F40E10.5 [Aphelenchus avenae]